MVQFVFTTSQDGSVCPQCSALAGSVYDTDEQLPDIPVHSNCRCRLILFGSDNEQFIPDNLDNIG